MDTKIFVNLPVKDLAVTMEFFGKLGFEFDPKFTNENAACMVVSQDIFVMLLVESFFQTFTKKELADATKVTEVITALSVESREMADELIAIALEAGAEEAREAQDLGFMYSRSFSDPNGHIWEVFWMDEAASTEEAVERASSESTPKSDVVE
jgi:predicted lactoylglutathione lyase